MYITIDRTNLRFMHKHTSMAVLGDLAWLELPHVVTHISPISVPFLLDFTELEIRTLYRNTTGCDHIGQVGNGLRAVLLHLAEQLSCWDGKPHELCAQAAAVPANNKQRFQFAPGSLKPAQVGELFQASYLTAERAENESLLAATGWKWAAMREAAIRAAQAEIGAAQVSAATPGERSEQRPAAAPRSGSVRDTIWQVADEMWEAAGKPSDKSEVLKLRKQVMDKLEEEYSVKRTSSSNELGNWQKNRLV